MSSSSIVQKLTDTLQYIPKLTLQMTVKGGFHAINTVFDKAKGSFNDQIAPYLTSEKQLLVVPEKVFEVMKAAREALSAAEKQITSLEDRVKILEPGIAQFKSFFKTKLGVLRNTALYNALGVAYTVLGAGIGLYVCHRYFKNLDARNPTSLDPTTTQKVMLTAGGFLLVTGFCINLDSSWRMLQLEKNMQAILTVPLK